MDTTLQIVLTVLGIVLAWLKKSPIKEKLPTLLQDTLAKADPAKLDELAENLATTEKRHDSAVSYVQKEITEHGIPINVETAEKLVGYLEDAYRAGIKFVKR
jgi:ABC-type Zn uptake system ZnuABC Zn-binding protein ZnuA